MRPDVACVNVFNSISGKFTAQFPHQTYLPVGFGNDMIYMVLPVKFIIQDYSQLLVGVHLVYLCMIKHVKLKAGMRLVGISNTVYVPIDAHCASADLRVRVYLKKNLKKNKIKNNFLFFIFC